MERERSDLSGRVLEADAPRSISVDLGDGTRRRLRVTREEAVDLAGKGTDVTRPRDRMVSAGGRVARKALRWSSRARS